MPQGLVPILVAYLRVYGRDAVKRMLTLPAKDVARLKVKGVDIKVPLGEQSEAVEQYVQFLESLVDVNFVDPDPEPGE